jgi:site-specific recombinase XerC
VGGLERAIDAYLTYLDVERGLSPATIRAYRSDLGDYAAARGVAAGWDRSADAAVGYLQPARDVAGVAIRASRRAASAGGRPR